VTEAGRSTFQKYVPAGRRIQGVNQIIEAWQGWAKAIADSKATFVAEYGS
jgi:hypothetical protein